MFNTLQIDLLREIKDKIWALTTSTKHTSEGTRAYMNVIGMLDDKIEEIRSTPQLRG
jgi:hypothetical protein